MMIRRTFIQITLIVAGVILIAHAGQARAPGRLGLVGCPQGTGRCEVDVHAAAWPSNQSFRAGAGIVDVNPSRFPVHVAGLHPDRTSSTLFDNLYSRALVLDDGQERIAIVVVDSCMLPRDLLDRAKGLASGKTGIRTDRMLISATHTHSAPAAMAALGTPQDKHYVELLPARIAESIELAASRLEPARIGWTVIEDPGHTQTRRAIRRSDRLGVNPWGEHTDRAMDPGYDPQQVTGPSGPSDPDLSVVAVQSTRGRPIALLANYANHFYGMPKLVDHSPVISADYFGVFAHRIEQMVTAGPHAVGDPETPNTHHAPFVGIMSQGTSGDQASWDSDATVRHSESLEQYSDAIAREVYDAYRTISYHDWAPIAMKETRLPLNFRVPDAARLAWAHKVIADAHGKIPSNVRDSEEYAAAIPYAYAVQQIYLHEHPTAELKLQAIRIGELGLTAIPNEVYALTGLKIKAQSPLHPTVNIELANGAEGYLPPPEQMLLGSYTTWPAHSAGLERQAEPKILDAVLSLLETVSGRPRRPLVDTNGPYAQSVLAAKPRAYWRLNEMSGPTAHDVAGEHHDATYEPGIVFYLPGPNSPAFSGEHTINRAPHFAGGRVLATFSPFAAPYTVEFWFWNAFPPGVREMTGWLLSIGGNAASPCSADTVALGLTSTSAGLNRLAVSVGGDPLIRTAFGTANIPLKAWTYVALVRDLRHLTLYLNGAADPDISIDLPNCALDSAQLYLGGSAHSGPGLEGKLDEVAIYDRQLTPLEISDHFRISGMVPEVVAR